MYNLPLLLFALYQRRKVLWRGVIEAIYLA